MVTFLSFSDGHSIQIYDNLCWLIRLKMAGCSCSCICSWFSQADFLLAGWAFIAGMVVDDDILFMQQFIQKEIQFTDRKQIDSSYAARKAEDEQEVQPCKFSELLRFADKWDKLLMVFGSIFSIANGFSLIFYARPLKDLINAYKPNYDFQTQVDNIAAAAHGFLMNGILVFLSCALMNISWTIASQRQLVKLRKLYYRSLLIQELQWYDRNKPEEICGDMYVQTQRAQNALVQSMTSMLTCLSMSIGSIIVSFFLGWRLALVLNSYIPVVVVLNYLRSKYNTKAKNATSDLTAKLNGNVFEVFQNIKTVKYLGGEDYELERYTENLKEYKNVAIPMQRKMARIWGVTAFFSYASVFALGFWYGVKLIVEDTYNSNTGQNYTIGDVVSIFFCMYISGCNFNPLSGHFANLNGCRIALAKIMKIVDRRPYKSEGFQPCMSDIEQIEFKNMTFHYNKPLFNNFNLTIRKGITALVGTSGNGKSTLLNLLVKFYEPFRGSIILSNENAEQSLKDIEQNSLRRRIGYVGQEPCLLGRTLRQILIAQDIEDKRIWEVLDLCCISELVNDRGLDTPFKAVSGGQKQRLAIARAVLRNPEILILDEGTSALDSINEKNVLTNLKDRSRIPFIIMIAHRVETLQKANDIFKINKGQVEKINREELVTIMKTIEEKEKKVGEEEEEQTSTAVDRLSAERADFSENESDSQKEEAKYKFTWAYFFKLLKINKKYKWHYVIGIFSAILLGSIFPSFSVILASLVNLGMDFEIAVDQAEKDSLVSKSHSLSALLFFFAILNLVVLVAKEYCFLEIGENLAVVLKRAAFKTTISMEMTQIDQKGRPNLVHLINVSAQSTKNLASQTISSFTDVSATLIIGLGIAFVYCWQITLVALLLIPLTVVGGMLQNKFLTTLSENSDKIMKGTHEMVIESIVNNRTVASLNLQEHYYINYEQKQDEGMKVTYRNSVYSGLMMAVSQCLIAFVICLIYYIAAVICENFNVKFSNAFIAIYAVMFSGIQAGTNIQFVGGLSNGFLRTAQYFQLVKEGQKELEYEPSPRKGKSNHYNQLHEQVDELGNSLSAESNLQESHGCIEFKNVYFRYPKRREYLFEGLSFMIKPGERVAVVGQSGTGKTTIADLLFGIYAPEQGEILIDKVNRSKFVRSKMAIVSQEPALFNRSVIDNIRYNLNVGFSEVQKAAEISDAFSFVEQGNFGNEGVKRDETVGEGNNWHRLAGSKGSLFSGGQKQRVAIARALVRKPQVLVMDEATSALDKDTEEKVLQNIQDLRCSQLIIAHRMSTIRSCDRIIVVKNGRLAEMGTFDQLIDQKGEFCRLVMGKKKE